MVEKLQFNLQNTDPTQKGFIEEGLLRSLLGIEAGQEAVVLDAGEEVAAGAGVGVGIGTMEGKGVIGTEAIVQTMIETVMMMNIEAGVGLLKVVVLAGPLMIRADHQAVVFHRLDSRSPSPHVHDEE